MAIILGIDPGTVITGFGIIEKVGNKLSYLASGIVKPESGVMVDRLVSIYAGIEQVVQEFKPGFVAVEKAFAHKNLATAIKLGQARGVAMAAAGKYQNELLEYTPRQIKKSVAGYGNAEKLQVQHMVLKILNIDKSLDEDAADALAIALCHCYRGVI